jgi:drug/metabolite transporter (DMT)-like permease
MSLAGASLVAAESILALTPIAIKKTPLDPIAVIWTRVLSSAILGYILTSVRTLSRGEWLTAIGIGYVNLLHIASSNESFRNLPAGQAMSLLSTYPMWNLVLGALFNGEVIQAREYGCIGLAAGGAVLLNMDPGATATSALGRKPNYTWGIFMGLIMALTESGMNTFLRAVKWMDPAKSVWVVSTSASLWLAFFLGLQTVFVDSKTEWFGLHGGTGWDAIALTAFHSITMFSGYWLRYYAVPRLSLSTYAILSYAGLIASYIFGFIFLKERPGWMSLAGAAVILVAGLLLRLGVKPDTAKK